MKFEFWRLRMEARNLDIGATELQSNNRPKLNKGEADSQELFSNRNESHRRELRFQREPFS